MRTVGIIMMQEWCAKVKRCACVRAFVKLC